MTLGLIPFSVWIGGVLFQPLQKWPRLARLQFGIGDLLVLVTQLGSIPLLLSACPFALMAAAYVLVICWWCRGVLLLGGVSDPGQRLLFLALIGPLGMGGSCALLLLPLRELWPYFTAWAWTDCGFAVIEYAVMAGVWCHVFVFCRAFAHWTAGNALEELERW